MAEPSTSPDRISPVGLEFIQATRGMGAKGASFMPELNETVATGLAAYYQTVAAQLHKWADPLSNEQFWRKPYPYGNSVGHLVLHMTGNLNYYIGARVAETGYVRDRDREFTLQQPPKKDEALGMFDRTIAMVVATIRKQAAADWGRAYTAELEPEAADRFHIFVRCAGHAYHHVGQIVYLSRELARA
jgi:uncharacterized damage-inducible protein DinB